MKLKITVNGVVYDVDVEVEDDAPRLGVFPPGGTFAPSVPPPAPAPSASASPVSGGGKAIQAPLAGTVSDIPVQPGQTITAGQTLLILEAMKMETAITAPSDGEVVAVLVAKGDAVRGGQVLLELK